MNTEERLTYPASDEIREQYEMNATVAEIHRMFELALIDFLREHGFKPTELLDAVERYNGMHYVCNCRAYNTASNCNIRGAY